MTRFYLRQNLEPLGSVCLCVGDFPINLDTSRYEALLNDVLGDSKYFPFVRQCFISSLSFLQLAYILNINCDPCELTHLLLPLSLFDRFTRTTQA